MELSWTVIDKWDKGYHQEALQMMNGGSMAPTEAMIDGRKAHANVAINKLHLNSEIKKDAIFETVNELDHRDNINRFEWQVNDWLNFRGAVDIYVPSTFTLIDLKSGKTPLSKISPMQVLLYALAYLHLFKRKIKRGILIKINKAGTKAYDYRVFKITPKKLESAYNYLLTIGSEIYTEINS